VTSFFTLDFKFDQFSNELQDGLVDIGNWCANNNIPKTTWGHQTISNSSTYFIHLQILIDDELAALQFKLAWADHIINEKQSK
jgi:hypothetical protein